MKDSVLTLVAATAGGLSPARAGEVARAVTACGARLDAPSWLAPEQAVDLGFDEAAPEAVEGAARQALAGAPVDLAAQPRAGRRKSLLVADMESTVIRNEMLDELAAEMGIGDQVAAITARAMRGEIDFAASLRQRVALLRGLPVARLEPVQGRVEIDPGAPALVATMRAHGAATALVSGGVGIFVRPVQARLGFDHARCNELEVVDDQLTGRVVEPILGRDAKARILDELCARHGCDPAQAVAVGDGANDLAMLRRAGLGVAFHAKPAVAAAARARVEHGDLRVLLYLQGYPAAAFREAPRSG